MTYQCIECGRKCDSHKAMALHMKSHRFPPLKTEESVVYSIYGEHRVNDAIARYKSQKVCVYDLVKEGLLLGKYLTLLGVKRSSSEERSTPRYKEKYLTAIRDKYGPNISNISQVDEVQKKKEKTFAEKHGSYDNYLFTKRNKMKDGYSKYRSNPKKTLAALNKMKATLLQKYGVINPSHHPDIAKKISDTKKERCSALTLEEKRQMTEPARQAWAKQGDWESKIEKRVQHCLVELGEDFTKHVFLFGFNYDILLPGFVLIEVQGNFWHANPRLYLESDLLFGGTLPVWKIWQKDKRKLDIATKNGYNVLYIWESEINSLSDDELCALIKGKIDHARRNC